jgi:DHA2 family multidrug resistance protein
MWTTTTTLAPAFGPLLGGYVCENWSWPWIFLINAPVVVVAAIMIWRLLYHRDAPPEKRPVDFTGFGMLVVWIGAAQLMLDRGADLDWFQSNIVIGLLIVAVIGFAAFLIWELTDDHPIVNLHVFANRYFSASLSVICLCFGGIFGSLVMTPLWLQTSMGYTPTWAAMVMVPQTLVSIAMSPVLGRLGHHVEPRHLMVAGVIAMTGTYLWRTTFNTDVTFFQVGLSQFIHGIGSTLFFSAAMSVTMNSVRRDEVPAATSLIAFCRTMAIAVAASALTTEWQSATARTRATLVDRFHGSEAAGQISGLGFAPDQTLRVVDNLVQSQAVMVATNHVFLILTGLFASAFVGLWLMPRGQRTKS